MVASHEPPRYRCIFCNDSNPIKLQNHHIIPRELEEIRTELGISAEDYGLEATLCASCHRVLHYLLRPLMRFLRIRGESMPKVEIIEEQIIEISKSSNLEINLQQELQKTLSSIIELEQMTGLAKDEDLFEQMKTKYNISQERARRLIGILMRDGTIYAPKPECYRRTV